MYLDALSFLEDERDAFRAYEALDALTDEQLDRPVATAGGWSGRDLMGHLVLWQGAALATAKELAMGERSPTKERIDAEWDVPGAGDRINDESPAGLPGDADRRGPRAVPERLGRAARLPDRGARGALDQEREHQEYFFGETIEHYEEHLPELKAILDAALG